MKTITPDRVPSQLELALDYKQPSLIRQFAREEIENYLKKEAQKLNFDGSVDMVQFISQLKPRIQIIAHGSFTIEFGKIISEPKRIRIIYKGNEVEV